MATPPFTYDEAQALLREALDELHAKDDLIANYQRTIDEYEPVLQQAINERGPLLAQVKQAMQDLEAAIDAAEPQ